MKRTKPTSNVAHISKRAQSGPNAIRTMFAAANEIDSTRLKEGLKPLISLGIGAPHIPANPLLDMVLQEWINKKRN